MRAVAIVAGIFGFTMIASGGQTIIVKAKEENYPAQYTLAPGTVWEEVRSFQTTRQLKFVFPDAKTTLNKETNKPEIAPEQGSLIWEYRKNDIKKIREQADREAEQNGGDADAIFEAKLKKTPVKVVDCRMVARKMVEHLIGHRIEVDGSNSVDGEGRRMQVRSDALDTALAAKQFDTITITRDATLVRNERGGVEYDPDAAFTCSPSVVPTKIKEGEKQTIEYQKAACGNLSLSFNPQPLRKGPLAGRLAIVVSAETCEGWSGEMDDVACELVSQVEGCGLRYTMKALQKKSGLPFQCDNPAPKKRDPGVVATAGLSDVLQYAIDKDACALKEGSYTNAAAPAPAKSAGAAGSSNDSVFEKGFAVPGSRQPAN